MVQPWQLCVLASSDLVQNLCSLSPSSPHQSSPVLTDSPHHHHAHDSGSSPNARCARDGLNENEDTPLRWAVGGGRPATAGLAVVAINNRQQAIDERWGRWENEAPLPPPGAGGVARWVDRWRAAVSTLDSPACLPISCQDGRVLLRPGEMVSSTITTLAPALQQRHRGTRGMPHRPNDTDTTAPPLASVALHTQTSVCTSALCLQPASLTATLHRSAAETASPRYAVLIMNARCSPWQTRAGGWRIQGRRRR
ncbi:hypothetical protein QBC39DRAFT_363003 [Podospora conica]|nr:hypothetical protein QBC39DRAFT_363003 [Schizothecium conicum]